MWNLWIEISILAPHEGERQLFGRFPIFFDRFQSSLPTRGSDEDNSLLRIMSDISIHAPHEGERRYCCIAVYVPEDFNPRSPRGGATTSAARRRRRTKNFNPRSPRGGATAWRKNKTELQHISIHAPHEGERLIAKSTIKAKIQFQSTLPTRGSDHTAWRFGRHIRISIHAPHEGERLFLNVIIWMI